MVVAMLGVLKAGGAYVPLDGEYPEERLSYMMEDAGAAVVITQEELGEKVAGMKAQVVRLEEAGGEIGRESGENLEGGAESENLAYVIYTSGSTGRPKGVAITHRSAVVLLEWVRETFSGENLDGVLASTSISFDLSVFELFGPLSCGGRVVLAETVLELGELKGEVRLVNTVPSAMAEMVRGGWLPESVRVVSLAGEALSERLVQELYGQGQIEQVLNLYGPTEDTTYSTWGVMGRGEGEVVTIGRPLPGTRAYVMDEGQEIVPVGVVGELYLGGAGLARGYLGRPGLTAERFVPDGQGAGEGRRLYRTGDLVRYLEDGRLEFVGRRDQQVKLRGYRIELGEIESVLRRHGTVREAVVVMRGEAGGQPRLVGYVVAENGEVAGDGELRRYLREHLPEYMVPGAWVRLAELPLTRNGKVDRGGLPPPASPGEAERDRYEAPRTEVEAKLAGIWAQVLGVERVGVTDNFFELGGDSILSIQIISRAAQQGMRLTPRQMFQHQTIGELAEVAGAASETVKGSEEQGEVTGGVELTPIQEWFFEQELAQPQHWNQAVMLRPRRELAAGVVEQAVGALERQHDALRMRFRREGGQWEGRLESVAESERAAPYAVIDLSEVGVAEREGVLTAAAGQVQRSLNLSAGPVWRCVEMATGKGELGRVLVVIHHLVVDGVSWRVLLEDLQRGCEQAGAGAEVVLPAKTTSWQRWAELLQEHAGSQKVLAEAEYWSGAGAGAGELPVDYAGGRNCEASVESVSVGLGEEETRALLREVPGVYRTEINDALLTGLGRALGRWTGRRQVVVELEGHGREEVGREVDVSRTVGWFTTLYPVTLEVSAESMESEPEQAAAIGTDLKRVKEQLRRVPGRGLGYGLLRYLSPAPALRQQLRQTPRPQVVFNYLGQFDQVLGEDSLWRLGGESAGPSHGMDEPRPHLLTINGSVVGGKLRLTWTYSRELHRRETIEQVAAWQIEALRQIISHCRQAGAGGYTPSDFRLARITQQELDTLAANGCQVQDLYPLSPTQQGMLFHSLYAPEAGHYIAQFGFSFRGSLDVSALKRAWQQVVDRNPEFRVSFDWEHRDQPMQIVHKRVTVAWQEEDWRTISDAEQQDQLRAFLIEDRRRGFDFSTASLMRLALIRLSEDHYRCIWSVAMLLIDGWSIPPLLQEVFACYEAQRRGQPARLPERRPYRDYIAWLQEQDLAGAETYWRETLRGFYAPTPLVIDRAHYAGGQSPIAEDLPGELDLTLSTEQTIALQALARHQQVTLNTVVQAAWALLLSRYSGESDVVFGVTVSGRPGELPGVETMLGLFINTLPLRVRIDESAVVGEWLRAVQGLGAEMRQYEYTPLVEVQRWSEIGPGRALFDSIVVFENYPVNAGLRTQVRQSMGLRIGEVHAVEQTNYALTLVVLPGDELVLRMSYERRQFTDETIRKVLRHLQVILSAMPADPHQSLAKLPLLTDDEREQLLVTWNRTETEYPRDRCIHELFERQVRETPDALAVSFADKHLTYAELNSGANQLAHYLQSLGVGPEVRVGICMERSLEMIVGLLGIFKAGGAYLALDPKYPRERLAFMLGDAQVPVLLTQQSLTGALPRHVAKVICLDASWPEIACAAREDPSSGVRPQNLAYVIYTSGSTGHPKGVQLAHQGVVNMVFWHNQFFAVTPRDRATLFSSLSFDASVGEIWPYLLIGASLHIIDEETRLSASALRDWFADRRITIGFLPTPLAESTLSLPWPHGASLRTILTGGDQLHQYPSSSVPFELVNNYGPTENTMVATAGRVPCKEGIGSSPDIGRPVSNIRLYVLNQSLQPVSIGAVGELYLGGAGLARGYLNRPGLTAERFVPDPFGSQGGDRLYRTGDQVRYLSDGRLEFLGRVDQQVKVRGFRIELGEIESVLSRHPAVSEAVVVAGEDAAGQKRLAGYVVSRNGERVDASELRAHLREHLPEYMVPTGWVMLEKLPLTPNGKVDRRALPAPESGLGKSGSYLAPRTATEELLAGVWLQVLGVERVGVTDNFFELGGHSLLATRVISRVREVFHVDVPLRHLFDTPTIEGLAAAITESREEGDDVETIARTFLELENLSEDEVKALLLEQNSG